LNHEIRSVLFIGGARSGKSRLAQCHAEAIASGANTALFFLATAQAFDDEMQDRIARHQVDRDARWQTVECPIDLSHAIAANDGNGRVLLVDCLTLWTSNLLLTAADIPAATDSLCAAVAAAQGHIILVTNEVGMGIVPDNALARQFRDAAGRVNQAVAAAAQSVRFVTAGLCLNIK